MLKYLIEKECKQFFRNPFLPKLILVMPLTVILIIPDYAIGIFWFRFMG